MVTLTIVLQFIKTELENLCFDYLGQKKWKNCTNCMQGKRGGVILAMPKSKGVFLWEAFPNIHNFGN